jgi:hypothetical protein
MAGSYYVLDRAGGDVVKKIECGEPIFSAPVVVGGRVYFATLGSRVYAVEPDGSIRWTWDFVKEVLKYDGDRWSGEQWCKHKGGKVTWRDQFCCAIDIAAVDKKIVVPVAGSLICLSDLGNRAELSASVAVPAYAGSEKPAIFGLSIAGDGSAYVQWHRRDAWPAGLSVPSGGRFRFLQTLVGPRAGPISGGLSIYCFSRATSR